MADKYLYERQQIARDNREREILTDCGLTSSEITDIRFDRECRVNNAIADVYVRSEREKR